MEAMEASMGVAECFMERKLPDSMEVEVCAEAVEASVEVTEASTTSVEASTTSVEASTTSMEAGRSVPLPWKPWKLSWKWLKLPWKLLPDSKKKNNNAPDPLELTQLPYSRHEDNQLHQRGYTTAASSPVVGRY